MSHPETPGYVKNATGRVLSGVDSRLDALVRKGGDPAKGAAETARYLRPMTPAEQQSLIKEGRAPSHLKTVLRTETTRILSGQKEALAIKKKKFVRWMIAPSHPAIDVCDPIATSDHGYGPGVYPAGSHPSPPAHVNCRCYLVTVPPEMVSTLSGGRITPKQATAEAKAWYDKYGPNGPYVPTQEELENLAAIAKQAGLDVNVPGFPKHNRPARLYEIKSRGRGGSFIINDITGVKVGDLVNYGDGYWLVKSVDGTEFLGNSQFDAVMWARAKFWSTKQANYKSLANAAFHTTADLRRASGLPRTTMDYYLRAGIIQPTRRTAAGRLLFDGDEIDFLMDIVKHRDNSLSLRNFREDFIYRREIMSEIELPSLLAPKRKHPRIVTESDGVISEVVNKKEKIIGNVSDAPDWIGTKEDKISWSRADYWHGKKNKPATAPNYRLDVADLDPDERSLIIRDARGNAVGDITKTKDGWSGLVYSKNQLITGDSLDDAASFIVRLDSVGKQNFELGDLIRIPQLRQERLEREALLGKSISIKDLQEIPDRPASAPPYRIGKTDLIMDSDNVFPTRINVEIQDLDGETVSTAFWTPETKWTAPIADTGQIITGRENFNDVAEYLVKKTVQPDMLDQNDLDFILALRREAGILDPIPGFTKGAGENYPKYVLKNQVGKEVDVFDSVYDQQIGFLEDAGFGRFNVYVNDDIGGGFMKEAPTYDDAYTFLHARQFESDEFNGYDFRFPEYVESFKGFNVMDDATGDVIGRVQYDGEWNAIFPEGKIVEFTNLEDAAQALYDRHKKPWDLSDLSDIMDESGALVKLDEELVSLDELLDPSSAIDLDDLIAVGQPENKLAHDVFGGFGGNQRLGTVFQDGYGRFSYELDDFPGFRKVGFDTIEEAIAEAAQMWDNLITAGFSGPNVRVAGNREILNIKGLGDFAWIEENVDRIRWDAYSVDIVDGTTYGIHRLDTKDEALDWIWDQQSWMKNTIPRPVLSTPDLNTGLTIERYVDGLGGLKNVKAVVRDVHGTPIAQVQYREYLDQYSVDYIFPGGKSSSYDYFDTVDEAVESLLNDRVQLDQVTQEWIFERGIVKRDDVIIDDVTSENFTLHVNSEFTGYDIFDSTGERAGHAIYSTKKMNPDFTPRLFFYDRHGDEVLDFANETELISHLDQFNAPEWAGDFNWDDYDDWNKTVTVWKDIELPEPIHIEEHGDVTIFERFGAVRRDPDGGWIGIRVEDNVPQHFLSQSDAINYTVGRDISPRANAIKAELGNFHKVAPNTYQWDSVNGDPVMVLGLHPTDDTLIQAVDYIDQKVIDFGSWDEATEYLEQHHLDRFLPNEARGVELPYGFKGELEIKQYPGRHEIAHNGVDVGDISPTWDGRWIARDIHNRQIEVDTYENALHFLTDVSSNETAAWRNRRIIAQEHGEQWMKRLNPLEVDSVRNYQTPEYQQINGVLRSVFKNARSRRGVDADAAGIVKAHEFVEKSESFGNDVFAEIAGLDSAMNKSTGIRREGLQAWRATDTGVLYPGNNPKVGDVFVDPGFFSTTIADPEETGGVMMENAVNIRVLIPGDAPGGYVPSVTGGEFEREFLLPRNGVFRIVDVDQSWGQVGLTTVELVDIAPTTDKRFRNFYEHLIEKAASREGLIPQWKMSKRSSFQSPGLPEPSLGQKLLNAIKKSPEPTPTKAPEKLTLAKSTPDVIQADIYTPDMFDPNPQPVIVDRFNPNDSSVIVKRAGDEPQPPIIIREKEYQPPNSVIYHRKATKAESIIIHRKPANESGFDRLWSNLKVWEESTRSKFKDGSKVDLGMSVTSNRTLTVYSNISRGINVLFEGLDVATERFPVLEIPNIVGSIVKDIVDYAVVYVARPSVRVIPRMIDNQPPVLTSKLKLAKSADFASAKNNLEAWGIEVDYSRYRWTNSFEFEKTAREAEILDTLDAVIRYHYERGLYDAIPPKMEFRSWEDAVASYDHVEDFMQLDIENVMWNDDELARRLYDKGYAASARREDIIVHEFAHRAWNTSETRTLDMDISWDEAFGKENGPTAKRIANEVSAYAAESPGEFIAEVYAKSYVSGNTNWASEEVKYLYNLLGGPPLPSEAKVINKSAKRKDLFVGAESPGQTKRPYAQRTTP